MKAAKHILNTFLFIAIINISQGQETEQKTIEIKKAVTTFVNSLNSKLNFTPFGGGNLANTNSNISATSSFKKGKDASIELVYKPKNELVTNIGFKVVQTVDDDATEAAFLDLNGITKGTTTGFNIQFGNPIDIPDAALKDFAGLLYESKERRNSEDFLENLSDIYNSSASKNKSLFGLKKSLLDLRTESKWFFRIGFDISKSEHNYTIDSARLVKNTENHIDPIFKITAGKLLSKSLKNNWYLSFGYKHATNYKDADKITVISPFGTTSNTISRSLVFGAPAKEIVNMANIECRVNLGIKQGDRTLNIGVAPVITADFQLKQWSLILPVYLVKGIAAEGKNDGLQGGFKLGYTGNYQGTPTSFKDGFAAQIIASIPFSLLKSDD
jgi:hypothetical protein